MPMHTTADLFSHLIEKQEELFQQINLEYIFENVGAGVMLLDTEGTIVYCNKAQCVIDESERLMMLGKKFQNCYANAPQYLTIITNALNKGKFNAGTAVVYQNPKGNTCHSILSAFPIMKAGNVTGAVCIAQRFGHSPAPPAVKNQHADSKAQSSPPLIGRHPQMLKAIDLAKTAALTPSPIMLCGETGTGKEVFARSIYAWSSLNKQPYVTVNCAAIPDSLAESILFGTAKGSFTGATENAGLFEQANGGILFLDEIDSMPMELQPKLLRVIQEMRVRRVGSSTEKSITVKIIAAAGACLQTLLQSKRIRMDLYYRLGVNVIEIPPLRERLCDLQELVNHFVLKLNYKLGQHFRGVAPDVTELFTNYHWPGNVRELEHALEACMNVAPGLNWITADMLPQHFFANKKSPFNELAPIPPSTTPKQSTLPQPVPPTLPDSLSEIEDIKTFSEESEKSLVKSALQKTYGNVTMAAHELGISRQLLHYKMKKYRLSRLDGRK